MQYLKWAFYIFLAVVILVIGAQLMVLASILFTIFAGLSTLSFMVYLIACLIKDYSEST